MIPPPPPPPHAEKTADEIAAMSFEELVETLGPMDASHRGTYYKAIDPQLRGRVIQAIIAHDAADNMNSESKNSADVRVSVEAEARTVGLSGASGLVPDDGTLSDEIEKPQWLKDVGRWLWYEQHPNTHWLSCCGFTNTTDPFDDGLGYQSFEPFPHPRADKIVTLTVDIKGEQMDIEVSREDSIAVVTKIAAEIYTVSQKIPLSLWNLKLRFGTKPLELYHTLEQLGIEGGATLKGSISATRKEWKVFECDETEIARTMTDGKEALAKVFISCDIEDFVDDFEHLSDEERQQVNEDFGKFMGRYGYICDGYADMERLVRFPPLKTKGALMRMAMTLRDPTSKDTSHQTTHASIPCGAILECPNAEQTFVWLPRELHELRPQTIVDNDNSPYDNNREFIREEAQGPTIREWDIVNGVVDPENKDMVLTAYGKVNSTFLVSKNELFEIQRNMEALENQHAEWAADHLDEMGSSSRVLATGGAMCLCCFLYFLPSIFMYLFALLYYDIGPGGTLGIMILVMCFSCCCATGFTALGRGPLGMSYGLAAAVCCATGWLALFVGVFVGSELMVDFKYYDALELVLDVSPSASLTRSSLTPNAGLFTFSNDAFIDVSRRIGTTVHVECTDTDDGEECENYYGCAAPIVADYNQPRTLFWAVSENEDCCSKRGIGPGCTWRQTAVKKETAPGVAVLPSDYYCYGVDQPYGNWNGVLPQGTKDAGQWRSFPPCKWANDDCTASDNTCTYYPGGPGKISYEQGQVGTWFKTGPGNLGMRYWPDFAKNMNLFSKKTYEGAAPAPDAEQQRYANAGFNQTWVGSYPEQTEDPFYLFWAEDFQALQDHRYSSALATYFVNALLWPLWLVAILIAIGCCFIVITTKSNN